MPSIHPGFQYDIFISYRHNDNLDGWVAEFVANLEKELKSTLKQSLSIYFDKNPHDGLLESHVVDKSLEEKLQCLIFIPIISQTYCDEKSFAWQNEFCAFNRAAHGHALGRDVKLSSGNVASRILPIKIHDLDSGDVSTIEGEIGGALRAIDFIYKEPGVNRPLKSVDSKADNLNKTDYRNQVNKVANAVKEIISSLKPPNGKNSLNRDETLSSHKTPSKKYSAKAVLVTVTLVVLFALGFLASQFIGGSPGDEPAIMAKSVAVLPFLDLSETKDQGWFSDGLTDEILNSLAHVNGLMVTSRTSSFAFKDKNIRIQDIADSLGVNFVVEGSIRKTPAGMRITAQLIRAKDGYHIWSNTYDSKSEEILVLQQDIASKIAKSLDVSLDAKAAQQMNWVGTSNAEAYLAFLKAGELDNLAHSDGPFIDLAQLKKANAYLEEAIRLDPDFINPYLFHADFYLHYVLKDDPYYRDTLSEKLAHKYFMNDLSNLVSRSKTEAQADYFRLFQIMYSNDWSSFRAAIEKVVRAPDPLQYFRFTNFDLPMLLLCLGYEKEYSELTKSILAEEPAWPYPRELVALSFVNAGKYEELLQEIATWGGHSNDDAIYALRLYTFLQTGRLDEAYELVSKDQDSEFPAYYDMKATILARKGLIVEAKRVFEKKHRKTKYYLYAVREIYGKEAANKEASLSDQKILLDLPLFRAYALSPRNLPFDLSSTPNFARKLRQAGVRSTLTK